MIDKKPINTLEGLIEALDELLDAYGDLPIEATQRGTGYSLKILDVRLTGDNSICSNPDGVIQIFIEES